MLGVVLAVSRAFIVEAGVACEPELALLEVVAHTHWLPRHWRGRAHTREVQGQFEQLFQFKARTDSQPHVPMTGLICLWCMVFMWSQYTRNAHTATSHPLGGGHRARGIRKASVHASAVFQSGLAFLGGLAAT